MNRRSFLARIFAAAGAATVLPFLPKPEPKRQPLNAWWKRTPSGPPPDWDEVHRIVMRHYAREIERSLYR